MAHMHEPELDRETENESATAEIGSAAENASGIVCARIARMVSLLMEQWMACERMACERSASMNGLCVSVRKGFKGAPAAYSPCYPRFLIPLVPLVSLFITQTLPFAPLCMI